MEGRQLGEGEYIAIPIIQWDKITAAQDNASGVKTRADHEAAMGPLERKGPSLSCFIHFALGWQELIQDPLQMNCIIG